MPQITRKLEFDAGHRVLGHESKCKHIHGHRYVAEVTVEAKELDSISRVVDFSVVKTLVGGWIDEYWDHNLILNENDPLVMEANKQPIESTEHYLKRIVGRLPYLIPNLENPTAEVMAKILFHKAQELLPNLAVTHVRLYETPACWADHYKEQ